MNPRRLLAVIALMLAATVGLATAAPVDVTGLAATVTPGDDTKINLSWSSVSGADGYYVYLVNNTPIQSQASSVTPVGLGTWTNIGNVKDGSYYNSASVTRPGDSSNVGVTLTFPTPRYIGAVSFIGATMEGNPGHTTGTYSLSVGATALASNAGIPWQRNGIISNEFRPILANTVTAQLGATYYDPDTGMNEVDVWEYQRLNGGNLVSGNSLQVSGLTPGQSYTYYVTASAAGVESNNLSNRASLLAGDRDDANSADSFVDAAGGSRTGYTRGGLEAYPARGTVANPVSGPTFANNTVAFNKSSTDTGTGDVQGYRIFRVLGAGTPTTGVETMAQPVNGGLGVQTKFDISSGRASNAIDGNLSTVAAMGASNYSEEDWKINFGSGRYFAMSGMQIYGGGTYGGAGNPQWQFRNLYVESEGIRLPDSGTLNLTGSNASGTPNDARLILGYNSTDRLGYADFNFSGINGSAQWLVGDAINLHFGNGENNPATRELILKGLLTQLSEVGYVPAVGSASYAFLDGTVANLQTYTYFIVAQDFAGNFSFASSVTGVSIPEPASLSLLALGGLTLLRRRRK